MHSNLVELLEVELVVVCLEVEVIELPPVAPVEVDEVELVDTA